MDPTLPMTDMNVLQLGLIDLLFNIVGILLNSLLTSVIVPAFNGFFEGLRSLLTPAM